MDDRTILSTVQTVHAPFISRGGSRVLEMKMRTISCQIVTGPRESKQISGGRALPIRLEFVVTVPIQIVDVTFSSGTPDNEVYKVGKHRFCL